MIMKVQNVAKANTQEEFQWLLKIVFPCCLPAECTHLSAAAIDTPSSSFTTSQLVRKPRTSPALSRRALEGGGGTENQQMTCVPGGLTLFFL